MRNLSFYGDRVSVVWNDGGVFPTAVTIDDNEIIAGDTGWLVCRLSDGRTAVPCVGPKTVAEPTRFPEKLWVNLDQLEWRDESGSEIPDFRLDLRYEFWNDGTAFVYFFFFGESCDAPQIESFSYEIRPRIGRYKDVSWGVTHRMLPNAGDAKDILPSRSERFLGRGTDRSFAGDLLASVVFECWSPGECAAHLEFFVEGHSTLSHQTDGCSSSVTWCNGEPTIRWDFQSPQYKSGGERPWQLRNQIGWLITPPPTRRHLPPLRMYHFLDNFTHYPTTRAVEKMAEAGADVLCLHENWRADVQNGGKPYDYEEFKRVVADAHSRGIRVAPYIRGNENAEVEEFTDWFGRFLKRDFDGLYMDFGGPYGQTTPPDIQYCGGRTHFRRFYMQSRARRERVGAEGLVLSHTGPTFTALGMTDDNVTGYVSGEGERGLMLRSRRHHAYFSGFNAVCGTMWTAAFPEYGTSAMIPFLASTGQFPHSPLGTQLPTSSLVHPPEPGTNDVFLRALWRLWGLFHDERDITVGNEHNGCRSVKVRNADDGFYLMGTADGKSALLILTNFGDKPRMVVADIDFAAMGLAGAEAIALNPTNANPGNPVPVAIKTSYSTLIGGHGVVGLLITLDKAAWSERLAEYTRPYPARDAADNAWLARIDKDRKLRAEPPKDWKEVYVRVSVPNFPAPYEEKLWWDLYAIQAQLVECGENGDVRSLGWFSVRDGLLPEMPEPECLPPGPADGNIVWPGHATPWIPLHKLLPAGEHKLAVRSVIATTGDPTYSFLCVTLSPEPKENAKGAYSLSFYNDIEPDREFIHWATRISQ